MNETLSAHLHSMTAFFNSLFKEKPAVSVKGGLEFQLNEKETLILPLKRHSSLGRHEYLGEIFIRQAESESAVTFFDAVKKVSEALKQELHTSPAAVALFQSRVKESVETIESTLLARGESLRSLLKDGLDFNSSEQALFAGHSFHPTPKSHDEFNADDLRMYSPEFGSGFKLQWLMVHPDLIVKKSADSWTQNEWNQTLLQHEFKQPEVYASALKKGMIPMPAHPWQLTRLLQREDLQKAQQQGLLVVLGASDFEWRATSSLRTIYRKESAAMLKFSMSLRLTNSVRHMTGSEVVRGLQLHDALETQTGKEFLQQNPHFHVIREPSFMALKNTDGSVMIESMVLYRENPFQGENASQQAVLATLTQDAAFGGPNLIQEMITTHQGSHAEWFKRYLNVVVRPLLLAQANFGVIMGAHQQNLILSLKQGYPDHAYFRDCHGTGYSELGYSLFAKEVSLIDRKNGNVVSESMGNTLFIYYLILNSTFNVISALAQSHEVSEAMLLRDLQEFLIALRAEGLKDSSAIDHLLSSDHLMHKGNFLCSFRNVNENTTDDPTSIYTPISNPLRRTL